MKWPFFKRERPENVKQSDIVIVIIGQTGAGKTSFINIATDEKLKVNKSLSPCTTEFAFVRCTFEDSREVVFVDTPPYPHPDVNASTSEEKVGKAISKWVKGSLGKNIKVTRILYLHNLSMNRLTEPLPHYDIFRELCGNQYSASVALVLTMCENVLVPATRQQRTEYYKDYWKKLMGEKAVVCSHIGTKESAWEVVTSLGVI